MNTPEPTVANPGAATQPRRPTQGSNAELRVYLTLSPLQPQFAAYLGTPTRARGYPPLAGQTALIVEVAPGLLIERVMDWALRQDPTLDAGILFVERQFGILELHGADAERLAAAGRTILANLSRAASDQLAPSILFTDVIEDLTDQHAVIINRTRQGSMVLPGQTLLLLEVAPALFAALAANEAEKAAPGLTLIDVQMIGAAGRVYLSGLAEDVAVARKAIAEALAGVAGRGR